MTTNEGRRTHPSTTLAIGPGQIGQHLQLILTLKKNVNTKRFFFFLEKYKNRFGVIGQISKFSKYLAIL